MIDIELVDSVLNDAKSKFRFHTLECNAKSGEGRYLDFPLKIEYRGYPYLG